MKESRDVWFNAFLLYKGYQLKDFKVVDPRRVSCSFDVTPEEWTKLKIEFQQSEITKFKHYLDQIKEMAY